jgi:hypothetical protein
MYKISPKKVLSWCAFFYYVIIFFTLIFISLDFSEKSSALKCSTSGGTAILIIKIISLDLIKIQRTEMLHKSGGTAISDLIKKSFWFKVFQQI